MNLRHLLLFAALSLACHIAVAQPKPLLINGTVLDQSSSQPIPFATVVVKDAQSDEILNGVTTDADGQFSLRTRPRGIYLEISFLGFESLQIRELNPSGGEVDLGQIFLVENQQMLQEATVEGERSTTEFQVDKRVFNVGSDLSSTGMGALELLNNVPSVNVSIEGQISLRGSNGVQILIDGKPSIMADDQSNALGTITADMIDRIEIITNPSAKYEAEGTAGILNIVLKKEEKEGLNGSVTVNTGIPDNHSLGVSLNRRTQKFNLFTQLGAGYRSLPRFTENVNEDRINNTFLESEGDEFRNETFFNIRLGTDYHINKNNVLTLSGNFAYEGEDQPSTTRFLFYEDDSLSSSWERTEVTEATNPKWQYELQYKKDFEDHKDHDLIFSALGRFFGKDLTSEFDNVTTFGTEDYADQQTRTKFQQADYTFKLDYTDPLNDKVTIETGFQYVLNDVGNDYAVLDQVGDVFVVNEDFTNNFEFDQKVLGVYGTGQYKLEHWGIKLGLRVENTDLNTLLITTNEANKRNYTNWFPSLHSSYEFSKKFSLQAGYSRRIYRPRLWDLNPFFNIRNNFNVRTGNPNLQPEFTDSYELTGIFLIKKIAFNTGVYYRYTTDVIERVIVFQDNVNLSSPQNIGTNSIVGFELNAEYRVTKWLKLTGDYNYNYFQRLGELEGQSFDFAGDRSSARLTSKFRLPAQFEVELTGNFRSGYLTVQSDVSGTSFMNIGLRKKFLKGKLVLNMGVRDVFASRIEESIAESPEFYLYDFRQRGRFLTLGVSYGFGKGEAMTYSGGRRR